MKEGRKEEKKEKHLESNHQCMYSICIIIIISWCSHLPVKVISPIR